MKILEIFSRKIAASQPSDALGFIAESQNLKNQYSKDTICAHSSETSQETLISSTPLEEKLSTEVKDDKNVQGSVINTTIKIDPLSEALKPLALNDQQVPSY